MRILCVIIIVNSVGSFNAIYNNKQTPSAIIITHSDFIAHSVERTNAICNKHAIIANSVSR